MDSPTMDFNVHIYHHFDHGESVDRLLQQILSGIASNSGKLNVMSLLLDNFRKELALNTDVERSAMALITKIVAEVQSLVNANAEMPQFQAVLDSFTTNDQALAAAVAAGTAADNGTASGGAGAGNPPAGGTPPAPVVSTQAPVTNADGSVSTSTVSTAADGTVTTISTATATTDPATGNVTTVTTFANGDPTTTVITDSSGAPVTPTP